MKTIHKLAWEPSQATELPKAVLFYSSNKKARYMSLDKAYGLLIDITLDGLPCMLLNAALWEDKPFNFRNLNFAAPTASNIRLFGVADEFHVENGVGEYVWSCQLEESA